MATTMQAPVAAPVAQFPSELKGAHELTAREIHQVCADWIDALNACLTNNDYNTLDKLFHDESWWRDLLNFTLDHKLLHGKDEIKSFVAEHNPKAQFTKFQLSSKHEPALQHPVEGFTWIQAFINFETKIGRGRGLIRLMPSSSAASGAWKCFTCFTSLEELKGFEEKNGATRPQGVNHGENVDRKAWKDLRHEKKNFLDSEPTVVVIGAGQAGLNLAARLGQLNVDTLIVDKNERIGDNWRKRYNFLVLHDPVWYDHMAYIPFPAHWPVFTPKDKLAEWFEAYANLMELNVWMKTEVKGATYDKDTKTWTVPVQGPDGKIRELHPKHVVLATGHSGEANIPHFEGENEFEGKICHSSQHTTGKDFSGKKAVVVGCCNSGHDIAHDFYEQGADVTIIQRSSTYIMSSENGLRILFEGLYEENGPDVEDADLLFASIPNPMHLVLQGQTAKRIADADKELLENLAKGGFTTNNGDGVSFLGLYFTRGGGYYLDVGASSLIAEGKIKVESGRGIKRFHKNSLELVDGTIVPADIVVLATGYQNMRTTAARILSQEVADQTKDVWGLDEQGELATIWRNSGHPGMWYMGGNLALCRYYSKRLALSIKMLEEGLAVHPAAA
ncbi:hypothetical protein PYCC9005_002380 [Savitreella phatthalungensis]